MAVISIGKLEASLGQDNRSPIDQKSIASIFLYEWPQTSYANSHNLPKWIIWRWRFDCQTRLQGYDECVRNFD
jgi:hypothetical protein